MLELTGVESVLRGIGWLYWLLAAGAIYLAISKGKSWRAKVTWAAIAIAVFGYLPAQQLWIYHNAYVRLQTAEAMFQERCKTAGEKIYRTADNVEGIFLMKLRSSVVNYSDQFEMDDPYGRDLGGEGYIKNFLLGKTAEGSVIYEKKVTSGYRYVEAVDPTDGKRYRYKGRIDEPWKYDSSYSKTYKRYVLDRDLAPGPPPRYGVTYDDISTRGQREYWIAGSSLKVIDLQTNEIMAERIGYMMDRGQGNTSGGRSPWLMAANHACPAFPLAPGNHPFKMNQTRDFVEKTLHIKREK